VTGAGRLVAAASLLALGLAIGGAGVTNPLDFVTFDGIDYVRWLDEPGRELTRADLGAEFATVGCSIAEDVRNCSFGMDSGAAYLPAGTRLYTVRGYAPEFRLAAAWRERLFLYQAWRNPRARMGRDLFDIAGRVRAIDVRRRDGADAEGKSPAPITAPADVEALVGMILQGAVRKPTPPVSGAPQYWVTIWLAEGTTLGRPYFPDSCELMGGLAVPPAFRAILDRYLPE
jgi:hypothetical protein